MNALGGKNLRTGLAYGAMLASTLAAYLAIRAYGESSAAPSAAPVARELGAAGHGTLAHVLFALGVITVLARVLGAAFQRRLRQPPVIGEIVAGIALGPSLLGAVSPSTMRFLLPEETAAHLGVIAKVGVVLFMFLVGLELDTKALRRESRATLAVSHASIVVPFVAGAALSLALYPLYSRADVSFTSFSLFMGVSMAVTAFPVLARILEDRGMTRTPLGALALGCAAVDDVTAWTLLAFVAGLCRAEVGAFGVTVALVAAYLVVMLAVVRPLAARFAAREEPSRGHLSHASLAVVLVALMFSAAATEAIGIHALFGGFLLGAMLPHEGRLANELRRRIEDVVVVLFLPSFFALTGMRTEVGLLGSMQEWLYCAAVIAVATAGKFGGSFVAARCVGIAPRDAAAIGVLMNTRGLMELVVLNVGLDLGVISPVVFAMLVVMALVTTFATGPLLDVLGVQRGPTDPGARVPNA